MLLLFCTLLSPLFLSSSSPRSLARSFLFFLSTPLFLRDEMTLAIIAGMTTSSRAPYSYAYRTCIDLPRFLPCFNSCITAHQIIFHEEHTSKRRTTNMATATKQSLELSSPRDIEELEGALLPPTAVPVDESQPQLATAAVPVEAFIYTEEDDTMMTAQADIPTAPFLPMYQDNREEIEQQAIAKAKRRGKIEAESEKQAVGKVSRENYAKNYHAKQKVEVANLEARRRNKEGVHVTEDKYTVKRGEPTAPVEKEEYAFAASYAGGYKVVEYDVTEYNTSDDYKVSEYKSVYDP